MDGAAFAYSYSVTRPLAFRVTEYGRIETRHKVEETLKNLLSPT